jgi:hypothetical protein
MKPLFYFTAGSNHSLQRPTIALWLQAWPLVGRVAVIGSFGIHGP